MADGPGSPAGGSHESGGEQSPHSNSNIREQDRFLPIANISRIMKKALPANGKIAKDAKDTVQECVSEFISFVTSEASDKCQKEKRKTINGDDLLWAMATLGFEDYIDPLKAYLSRYREVKLFSQNLVSDMIFCFFLAVGCLHGLLIYTVRVPSSRTVYTRHEFFEFACLNFQALLLMTNMVSPFGQIAKLVPSLSLIFVTIVLLDGICYPC
ncbi:Histone-fold [Cynara cardunculus var. scolymus]|uniref:Histone-fold n=1 Tax=Cynara cardunculus var. scolymus TaxID=59895 RepID=A0A124SHJ5_CYNCS|nr:Histone-fold [Cynara cardunculus var. scolymus]